MRMLMDWKCLIYMQSWAVQSVGSTLLETWKTKYGRIGVRWIQTCSSETSCLKKMCNHLSLIRTVIDKWQNVHTTNVNKTTRGGSVSLSAILLVMFGTIRVLCIAEMPATQSYNVDKRHNIRNKAGKRKMQLEMRKNMLTRFTAINKWSVLSTKIWLGVVGRPYQA